MSYIKSQIISLIIVLILRVMYFCPLKTVMNRKYILILLKPITETIMTMQKKRIQFNWLQRFALHSI